MSIQTDSTMQNQRLARKIVYGVIKVYGGSEEGARALELAVGEALANACEHAYPDSVGPVAIEVSVDGTLWTDAPEARHVPGDCGEDRRAAAEACTRSTR